MNTEVFSSAFRALSTNKARTLLTMLGVIIGVFAVIALVAVVKGVENNITGQFNKLGSNLLLIAPGRTKLNQDPAIGFTNNKFEMKHVELIEKNASRYIEGVVPNIRANATASYKSQNFYASLGGTSYNALDVVNFNVTSGRFFNPMEQNTSAKVAILGPEVKRKLFGEEDPLDKEISIESKKFVVIGILDAEGFGSDDRIVMPYTTIEDVMGIKQLSGISAKVRDGVDLDEAVKEVSIALLDDLKPDDFSIITQKDIIDSVQSILNIISIGLSAIAGISLLVGGIGIMNIMLVSVNERIREIGLRKALGATSYNIGIQFLLESLMISMTGGIVGIILGYALTLVLTNFFPAEVPLWTLFLSFTFSLFVGLAFGTYPAIKASRKDPIEALRYE
jgi:putative ABC transport system permease protein